MEMHLQHRRHAVLGIAEVEPNAWQARDGLLLPQHAQLLLACIHTQHARVLFYLCVRWCGCLRMWSNNVGLTAPIEAVWHCFDWLRSTFPVHARVKRVPATLS